MPSALAKNDIEATLRQVVEEVIEDREPGDWRERSLASLACHGAIKAGRTLTSEEMRKLVRKLEVATFPMTCPHGDPIIVHLSQAHLERQFGRR